MPHNDYSRRPALWTPGAVPNARDFSLWSTYAFQSVNGDNGGTWNPLTPIIIGGAGETHGVFTAIQGGVTTQSGGRLQLGHNDFPNVSPSRTRIELGHIWKSYLQFPGNFNLLQLYRGPNGLGPYGIQSTPNALIFMEIEPRYLHQGATLTTIKLGCRMLGIPLGLPILNPQLTLYAASSAGALTNISHIASAWLPWAASTPYALNKTITPTAANVNGFWYQATSISGTGTSGLSEPIWPTTIGNTVVDNPGANQIVWTNEGYDGRYPINQANVQAYAQNAQPFLLQQTLQTLPVIDKGTFTYVLTIQLDNAPNASAWVNGHPYVAGNFILATGPDGNSYLFLCIVAGTSGGTIPVWPIATGALVTDGTSGPPPLTWKNLGPQIPWVLHSLELDYSGIATLSFE